MRVLKFGGSSVESSERIRIVSEILLSYQEKNIAFAVVFSAFGGVTDTLLELALLASSGDEDYKDLLLDVRARHLSVIDELLKGTSEIHEKTKKHIENSFSILEDLLMGVFLVREASLRTKDYILSFGERSSAYIISQYLISQGINAKFLDARKIIVTNKNFGNATVNKKLTYERISSYFSSHPDNTHVITGFISADKGGLTTTLGRGGSDYTASLIGAALNAEIIEIWTDVPGILTCDPRIVPQAFTIPKVSYNEAYEMSHFGAKVIYPPTIKPAHERNIPLRIKNTFDPEHPGTLVSHETTEYKKPVKGVSSIKDVCLLTLQGSGLIGVPGSAGRLFHCLAQSDVNIIMITQGSSEHSITFAISPQDVSKAKVAVEDEFKKELTTKSIDPLIVERDLSVLAIIGENMRYVPGIAAKMMWALGSNGINASAIAQGSSELNISVVVDASQKNKGLLALHEAFFLSEFRVINLFVVGLGLIGKSLMNQIASQLDFLREERHILLRIIGIANSKKMFFDINGIDASDWKEILKDSDTKTNISEFVEQIKSLNLNNSVFVDNTADSSIPNYYKDLLKHNISVCTPNKIAASSSYVNYKELRQLALENSVSFGYETNVGAGLPVLSTIKNLIDSGDRITRIEGVLSGSLSYIFNTFSSNPTKSFASIVREAKELGFTEPDPRSDLFGSDVRRKIVILAREAGHILEESDVEMSIFLPQLCMEESLSVDAFLSCLEENDSHFDQLRKAIETENKKPVFLASWKDGKAFIKLNLVSSLSPFFRLNGSDNMIVIHSQRYNVTPLVVQGPGAGAEVTAAGIFAEIMSIAHKNLSI